MELDNRGTLQGCRLASINDDLIRRGDLLEALRISVVSRKDYHSAFCFLQS